MNIDHVATLRQQRFTPYPRLLDAARACEAGGAKQITVHLREDRRHIQDADVELLRKELNVLMNLEMAATDEMVGIACKVKPDWVCLVPEKRQELTTEGGLKLDQKLLSPMINKMHDQGIKVSLFVEPDLQVMEESKALEVEAVEIHTGHYCELTQKSGLGAGADLLAEIDQAGQRAAELGMHSHAGHGIDYENAVPLAKLGVFEEFNIGHSIVCRAVMVGLEAAVREMGHLLGAERKA